jgi:hypothetical protein
MGDTGHKEQRPHDAKHPKRTYYDKGLSPSNTKNKLKYTKNFTASRVEIQKLLTH